MTDVGAILILVCVIAILILIGHIRIKLILEYAESGFSAKLRLGAVCITLYPLKLKKKRKKDNKAAQKEAPTGAQPAPRQGGSFALIKAMLPLVGECVGKLRHKLLLEKIYLDLTVGAANPAAAAMAFGGANAFVGMLWPHIEGNFNVKEQRIRTAVDFHAKALMVYLYGVLRLTVGQAVILSLRLLVKFLKLYTKYRAEYPQPMQSKQTEKEAV